MEGVSGVWMEVVNTNMPDVASAGAKGEDGMGIASNVGRGEGREEE